MNITKRIDRLKALASARNSALFDVEFADGTTACMPIDKVLKYVCEHHDNRITSTAIRSQAGSGLLDELMLSFATEVPHVREVDSCA